MTVSQAMVALSGAEQGGTDLSPYPVAGVGLHEGDSNVVFLDQEEGGLIAQGALEGGHAGGGIG